MLKKIFNSSKKTTNTDCSSLNFQTLPRHVAIIMDGNGRWAKLQGLIRTAGHRAGMTTLHNIVKTSTSLGIEALTVYAFSTENWKRPVEEVDFLMKLFVEYLQKELAEMMKDNVRLRFIGKINELPQLLQDEATKALEETKNNAGLQLNIAVNYGGQDELLRGVKKIVTEVQAGRLPIEDIDVSTIENSLDTWGMPPVDLVIRTSGDMRLSNFLLWQTAYAEFWFTDTNWPDFTPENFIEALRSFESRDRRFGGLNK